MSTVPRSAKPGIHPAPAADIARRKLPLVAIRGPLFRVHRAALAPLFFGKTGDNRFDDPRREYGVLYSGESMACAFIETFGEPLELPFVTSAEVDARKLSRLELAAPLRVVNLSGAGLRKIGADARLFAADHLVAQKWSRALFEHPAQPDGIRYPARHDPAEMAVALFERARASIRAATARETLGHASNRAVLAAMLDRYELGLV